MEGRGKSRSERTAMYGRLQKQKEEEEGRRKERKGEMVKKEGGEGVGEKQVEQRRYT